MELEHRPARPPVSFAGTAVAVAVGVVAAIVAFHVLAWIAGVAFMIVKVAVVVGLIGLALRFLAFRRR